MSLRRNSVGLPTNGLVERNTDYNELIEIQDIQHSQEQQQHQPQPQVAQRPTIKWENILPLTSVKVLLVENDDSTRYAVSALLRNCSYEVTAVSNGLEAWKTLEDRTTRVDLVLTELAIPFLSGIDLLSKIMSDKSLKNIPLIMMSSNNSMNIVFKCLSNGAVDVLVKPIRKNELKNIWQHIWRKCHSVCDTKVLVTHFFTFSSFLNSDGSGSESGIQTQKSNSVDGSNIHTNSKEGNVNTRLTFKNESNNDSSACSERALEVDCSQPISQLGDDTVNLLEFDKHDDIAMGKGKDLTLWAFPNTSKLQKDEKKPGKEIVEDNMTVTTNRKDSSCGEIKRNESLSDPSKMYNGKEPSLELSLQLQRLRDVNNSFGTNAQTQTRRNILTHSDHSAFSRYNTISMNKQSIFRNPDFQPSQVEEHFPDFGMTNKLKMGIERNATNYESGLGSNGPNGNNIVGNNIVGGTNVDGDNNTLGTCVVGSGDRSAIELQERLALRGVALMKFRLKRKALRKKVRYQSRKKLAEERPRIRGQFIRQALDKNKKSNV